MEKIKQPINIFEQFLERIDIATIGLEREKGELLREIIKETINETGEYFDEEKFIKIFEAKINKRFSDENDRKKIFDHYFQTTEEGTKQLKIIYRENFEFYFRKSPEKKGINFRDQIKDSQELRSWLFLVIQDEELRNKFREDFQRSISQREVIYFRLFPPSIGNFLRSLIGKEPVPFKFESGEMLKEYRSYIEDLQKGKDRITFWFEEDLLPDVFKKDSKIDEELLKKAGIEKKGDIYEFYIQPENIKDFIQFLASEQKELTKGEVEFNKLLKETKDLYNEVTKLAPKEIKNSIIQLGSLLAGIEEYYLNSLESGITKEEIKNLKNNLNSIKDFLLDIKKDLGEKEKEPDLIKKVGSKIKDFLKSNGPLILTSLGLWGLVIGWYLPLWLISKMYEQIEKGPLMK